LAAWGYARYAHLAERPTLYVLPAAYKEHKHSTRRIDLAVCAITAYSVAATVDAAFQLYWYEDAS
jgi:hypothetical protein